MQNIKQIYKNFNVYIPLLIAFLLPFGINLSILIIAWSILFVLFDNIKNAWLQLKKNYWFYTLILFFIVHVLGYWFSENKHDALNAIEIKLGFLAFPILIFSINYSDIEIKKIITSFVSGNTLAAFFCLFRATYLYLLENMNAFFYSEFSFFMHPSYFAMYLIFAQLIVMLYYPKWLMHLTQLYLKIGFISLTFLITIFLCSSKMGLITAFVLLPSVFTFILYQSGYKKTIVIVLTVFVLGIVIAYKLFPTPFERLKFAFKVSESISTIDKTDGESTAVRVLIWQESIKIIKQHFLFGTSAGDANDKLVQAYEQEGMTGALRKKLNAHNQYLQTFIGTGLIGFVILLLMTIGVLVYSIYTKNLLLMLFSALTTSNFLVESMLQAQAGFIFFIFFLCFLLKYNVSNFKNNSILTKPL